MRHRLPGPNFYRDPNTGSLYIDGYRYMGRVRMPSMPPRIAMVDRVTGTIYVLSHDGVPGAMYVQLVAIDPKWTDVHIYQAYEGPYTGNYRLYIADGVLAAEWAPGYNSQTILTRRNYDTHVIRIKAKDEHGACVLYTSEYDM